MGRALASVRDELLRRKTQLSNAYPRSGPSAVPAERLYEAMRAVEEARSELEDALYREHPETADTSVYYPLSENRDRAFSDPRRA